MLMMQESFCARREVPRSCRRDRYCVCVCVCVVMCPTDQDGPLGPCMPFLFVVLAVVQR